MFCMVADLEAFLQVTIPAEKVAAAERAIREVTGAIQGYCHQVLELVEDDELMLDVAAGQTRLFLPELPVVTVSEIVEDGDVLVAADDYKLGQHGILHRLGQNWLSGIQVLTITYSHGYETLPDDLVGVATRAAARAYQAGLRAEEAEAVPGVTAKALGDYSVSFGGESGGASGEGVLGASAAPLLLRSEKEALSRYHL